LQQFATARFLIQATGVTDRGQVRSHNEDCLGLLPDAFHALAAERGYLFAVADGMGGAEKGEVASELAIATLFDAFYHHPPELRPEEALERSFQLANAVVYREGQQLRFGMMGTTLVACLVVEDRAIIANVGDSRAYLIRRGQWQQLTEDHSWVAEQVRHQLMTAEEAQNSPQRNIITRAIGHQPTVEVALYTVPDLQVGDVLLLCSDGLHGMVPDAVLATVPLDGDLVAAAQQLVHLANEAGGHDNITCLLVRLLAAPPPPSNRAAALETTQQLAPAVEATQRLAPASEPARAPRAPEAVPEPRAGPAPPGPPGRPRRAGQRLGALVAVLVVVGALAAFAVGLVFARGVAPAPVALAPPAPQPTSPPVVATPLSATPAPPAPPPPGGPLGPGTGVVTVQGQVQLPFGAMVVGERDWQGEVYVVAEAAQGGARFASRVATEDRGNWRYELKLPPGSYQLSIEPEVAFRTATGGRVVYRLRCHAGIAPGGAQELDLVLQPASPGSEPSGAAPVPCEAPGPAQGRDGQQPPVGGPAGTMGAGR
jgi:protein phosphatase